MVEGAWEAQDGWERLARADKGLEESGRACETGDGRCMISFFFNNALRR